MLMFSNLLSDAFKNLKICFFFFKLSLFQPLETLCYQLLQHNGFINYQFIFGLYIKYVDTYMQQQYSVFWKYSGGLWLGCSVIWNN